MSVRGLRWRGSAPRTPRFAEAQKALMLSTAQRESGRSSPRASSPKAAEVLFAPYPPSLSRSRNRARGRQNATSHAFWASASWMPPPSGWLRDREPGTWHQVPRPGPALNHRVPERHALKRYKATVGYGCRAFRRRRWRLKLARTQWPAALWLPATLIGSMLNWPGAVLLRLQLLFSETRKVAGPPWRMGDPEGPFR